MSAAHLFVHVTFFTSCSVLLLMHILGIFLNYQDQLHISQICLPSFIFNNSTVLYRYILVFFYTLDIRYLSLIIFSFVDQNALITCHFAAVTSEFALCGIIKDNSILYYNSIKLQSRIYIQSFKNFYRHYTLQKFVAFPENRH